MTATARILLTVQSASYAALSDVKFLYSRFDETNSLSNVSRKSKGYFDY